MTFGLLLMTGMASAQSVSGSLGAVTRGGSARGSVTLSIPGGLHVNSNRPNSKYAIPTTVKLIPEAGVKVSAVAYPRGKNQKFQFSEDTLNVYDGRVTFTFNVTVPATFKGNSVRVRAVVRYQACTDEVCYAPTSKEVTLTARVR
jgi:DsbC/DsbD-like thiol-disulfide interchange protein